MNETVDKPTLDRLRQICAVQPLAVSESLSLTDEESVTAREKVRSETYICICERLSFLKQRQSTVGEE